MRTVRFVFTAVMFFCVLAPVSSAMFTVSVVETGVAEDAPFTEASTAWESGLIDALFESGHIVSNFPLLRSEGPYELDTALFGMALEGGSNYLCLAILEYDEGLANENKTLIPKKSLIQIYSLHSSELLVEGISTIVDTESSIKEQESRARDCIRALLAKMEG